MLKSTLPLFCALCFLFLTPSKLHAHHESKSVRLDKSHQMALCSVARRGKWNTFLMAVERLKELNDKYIYLVDGDFVLFTYCRSFGFKGELPRYAASLKNDDFFVESVSLIYDHVFRKGKDGLTLGEWLMAQYEESQDEIYLKYLHVVEAAQKKYQAEKLRIDKNKGTY